MVRVLVNLIMNEMLGKLPDEKRKEGATITNDDRPVNDEAGGDNTGERNKNTEEGIVNDGAHYVTEAPANGSEKEDEKDSEIAKLNEHINRILEENDTLQTKVAKLEEE